MFLVPDSAVVANNRPGLERPNIGRSCKAPAAAVHTVTLCAVRRQKRALLDPRPAKNKLQARSGAKVPGCPHRPRQAAAPPPRGTLLRVARHTRSGRRQSAGGGTTAAAGMYRAAESWPTAAVPMDNPHRSCKLTRAPARTELAGAVLAPAACT